jgi:hypothetical protein
MLAILKIESNYYHSLLRSGSPASRQLHSAHVLRRLAQTIPAQTILAGSRHRQPCGLLGAPAGVREPTTELGAATGADEATCGGFLPICHDLRWSFSVIFMSGSSLAALY